MKNDSQEFFLSSDPKEIKQAMEERGELISLFPKSLGKEDKTIYALLNNDNSIIGVFRGVNYNVQKPQQTLKVPELENNTKTPLENNYLAQKRAYNNPYNLRSLTNKQKSTFDTKTVPVANKNLKTDNTKLYNQPDSIWNTNREHSTSMSNNMPKANNTEQSKNTLKIRYFPTGEKYTHQINELKARLPKGVQNVLNELGTEIRVGYNLHTIDKDSIRTDKNGIYNLNKITLDNKHVNLLSEAIHATQDYLGMTGYGKANLEFQEHVIKDLYFQQKIRITDNNESYYGGFSNSNNDKYVNFISSILDENGILDLNKFLSDIENYIDEFQEQYKQSNFYQTPIVKDFVYNWIKLLDIFGIKYK